MAGSSFYLSYSGEIGAIESGKMGLFIFAPMRLCIAFLVLFFVCLLPADLLAQGCSICTKTASELDETSARGLNKGILYLAFLPLTIIGTVGFIWYRHREQ